MQYADLLRSPNWLCTQEKSSYRDVGNPIRDFLVVRQMTALVYEALSFAVAALHSWRRAGLLQDARGWVREGASAGIASETEVRRVRTVKR